MASVENRPTRVSSMRRTFLSASGQRPESNASSRKFPPADFRGGRAARTKPAIWPTKDGVDSAFTQSANLVEHPRGRRPVLRASSDRPMVNPSRIAGSLRESADRARLSPRCLRRRRIAERCAAGLREIHTRVAQRDHVLGVVQGLRKPVHRATDLEVGDQWKGPPKK